MDLEREKGITILAKNTAVRYGGVKLNIVDTPGHADFGGEVERGLTMVDAVLLLVDASEGPLPQTRFVLRKALEARLPVILVVNKVDRPDARIDEVVDEVYELFLDLDADESQIEFPIVYTNARAGWATLDPSREGTDLKPLFDLLLERVPAPEYDPGHPFQAHVTNLDSSPYVGRIAICRVRHGRVWRGETVAWCRGEGRIETVKVTELYVTEALDRVEADEAAAGEIISVAGIPEITIGDTLADAEDPRPLPVITVDEPSLSVTIGINTSPLAGQDGDKLTASQLKNRLDRELVGNVSLRVRETERPDVWEVQGRGEMALAVLVELMRREGFELTVGKPQVVTREIDDRLCEPVERMTVDVPEEYVGVITQLLAMRKGRLEQMVNHGTGWVRMDYLVPARGLIGFRTEFLTETRGTGVMHHVFERWEPWHGDLRTRPTGSLIADRRGAVAAFALFNLQERGTLFVAPGEEVYEGMIVGENSRAEDLDVNAIKEKHLTNMRSSTADVLVRLVPKRELSLDQALEFLRADECVEVTPHAIRLRKATLDVTTRRKLARSSQQ
jgi:GTP-binding protein